MKKFLIYLKTRPVAFASAVVLAILYALMLFAPFFAPYTPSLTREGSTYHPANVRITSQGLMAQECRVLNPVSWQYARVKGLYHKVRFFAKGEQYKLLGFIPCRRHLFGTETIKKAVPPINGDDGAKRIDKIQEAYPIYLLGADNLGRDLFSRIVYGSRISLTIGFVASALSLALAVLIGGAAGYYGGAADWSLMRAAEFFMLIPSLYLILFLRSLLNTQMSSGQAYMIITVILSLVGWPSSARTVRGMVHAIKREEFVMDAGLEGVPPLVVVFAHIIPQMASLLIVSVALSVPGFIMSETTLSYLGLGIADPAVSWGSLINRDITTLSNLRAYPWLLSPVWLLLAVTLAFNFLADALRDYLDPYHAVFKRHTHLLRRLCGYIMAHGIRLVSWANIAVVLVAAVNAVVFMAEQSRHPEWSADKRAAFVVMFRYIIPLLSSDIVLLVLYKTGVFHRFSKSKGKDAAVKGKKRNSSSAFLSIQGLCVTFPSQALPSAKDRGKNALIYAVRGVSFNMKKGEVLGIVGESGSGKSVTTTAIARLTPPAAEVTGHIYFEGEDLLQLNDEEMRSLRGRKIGMIFQEPGRSFDPLQSIGNVFFEAFRVIEPHIKLEDSTSRAAALLAEVGIENPTARLKNFPHQFSGGQLQRIGIALSLAQGCKLLIADECTTALDVSTQAEVVDLLMRIRKERNLSIIFISHNIDVVSRVADRIAVMYGGRIMETGDKDQILLRPRHPYTQALLASSPKMGDHYTRGPMGTIPGRVADPANPAPGCPFASRCPKVHNECHKEDYSCLN